MPKLTAETILMGMATGLLTFGVSFLKELSDNIAKLNVQMAQVIDRTANSHEILRNHELRISNLEKEK